jgi:hypothetical protein
MEPLGLFKYRKETEKETLKRILELTEEKDCGIFAPPMDPQIALDELARHLLGEDWYSVNPVSKNQINTEIVYEIERRYNVRRVRSR